MKQIQLMVRIGRQLPWPKPRVRNGYTEYCHEMFYKYVYHHEGD